MFVVVEHRAILGEVREHRPADVPAGVDASGMHRPPVPEHGVALGADEFEGPRRRRHPLDRLLVARQRRPVGAPAMGPEHRAVAAGVDGEAAAPGRDVVQVDAQVELLAHLVRVRRKRLGRVAGRRGGPRKHGVHAPGAAAGAKAAQERGGDGAERRVVGHEPEQEVRGTEVVQFHGGASMLGAQPPGVGAGLRRRRRSRPPGIHPGGGLVRAQPPPAGLRHSVQQVGPDALQGAVDGRFADQAALDQEAVRHEERRLGPAERDACGFQPRGLVGDAGLAPGGVRGLRLVRH